MSSQGKKIKLDANGQTNTIPIQEFSLNDLTDNAAIVMVAKRNSGKSWVVRAILHHIGSKVSAGAVISQTDRVNPFYKKFIPDSYIHNEFKSDFVKKIFERQRIIKEKAEEHTKQKKKINPKAFLVMDDCLADKGSWAKDKTIYELLFNGRHYALTYILTMQYPLGITPDLRSNFDYVFLLADDTFGNQKRIYEQYAGIFPNFEAFRQVFMQLTQDHGCMVIKAGNAGNNLLDKVMYYKAPDLTNVPIVIGGRQYNKFHTDNYDEERSKRSNNFDLGVDERFAKNNIKGKKLMIRKVKNDSDEHRRGRRH